jgi:hypothetical protein
MVLELMETVELTIICKKTVLSVEGRESDEKIVLM